MGNGLWGDVRFGSPTTPPAFFLLPVKNGEKEKEV
jgi:hypothetical protein